MFEARNRLIALSLAAAALGAAACSGDSTTSAESSVRVSAVTVDDNPSSTSSTSSGGSGSSTYNGTLTGTVQAQISTDGSTWVDLGSPTSTSIALQSTGNVTTLATNATVPVGTYAYARLVITPTVQLAVDGTANGSTYNGTVASFTSGQIVIEKQVQPVTVAAGSTIRVAWDLNSESWLNASSFQSQSSLAAAVQTAAYATIASQ